MATDNPTPLASSADFNATAYADLATYLQAGDLDATMIEATRACESACGRRLAPFSITESQRLTATDVEDAVSAALPLPMQSQINLDYARALGYSFLVRHAWVREYPPLYPDLWTGSITAVQIKWSYGQILVPDVSTIQYETDTGHVQFLLGTFVPPGSTGVITYSGGYATVPADLKRAAVVMAASIILKSLDPGAHSAAHDPDLLRDEAIELLDSYMRD